MTRFRTAAAVLTLFMLSCSSDSMPFGPTSETVDDLMVTLAPEDRADRIIVNLEVRNLRSTERTIQFAGTCNPSMTVYDSAADQPVWDERQWRVQNAACLPVLRNADLVAGGVIGVRYEIEHSQILGDSLPPDVYRIVVAFTMNQPEAALELEAGVVRLEH